MTEYYVPEKTMYYLAPGSGQRDYIPAGTHFMLVSSSTLNGVAWVQIAGTDPNPWRSKWIKQANVQVYPPPEPDPTIFITHRIEVYNDGSITVDGSFIPVVH